MNNSQNNEQVSERLKEAIKRLKDAVEELKRDWPKKTMNQPSYPDFQSMPAKELRKYAKERGVVGYSGLDKDSLITKLCRHILINEGFNLDDKRKSK